MADFEDSNAPTWDNLHRRPASTSRDAVRRTIAFTDPATARRTRSTTGRAVLMVRPRGWHLVEKHVLVDGRPVPGSLFDFGLYFFHNARELLERGTGPYFYLPKMESHLEARLWNDVFVHAAAAARPAPRHHPATVLIETLPAAFEMDEILYELRDHSAGLNCGRWDYIFSFIKKLAERPGRRAPRPRPGHDGRSTSCAPTPSSSSRPATAAASTPWAAWRRRSPSSRPRRQRGGARQGARRQAARGQRRPRRHLGRAPRPRARRASEIFDAAHDGAEPARPRCARTCTSPRRDLLARPHRHPHRGGPPPQHRASACSTSRRGCAAPAACRSTT